MRNESSHDSECEDYRLLGCDAVWLGGKIAEIFAKITAFIFRS